MRCHGLAPRALDPAWGDGVAHVVVISRVDSSLKHADLLPSSSCTLHSNNQTRWRQRNSRNCHNSQHQIDEQSSRPWTGTKMAVGSLRTIQVRSRKSLSLHLPRPDKRRCRRRDHHHRAGLHLLPPPLIRPSPLDPRLGRRHQTRRRARTAQILHLVKLVKPRQSQLRYRAPSSTTVSSKML